MEIGVRSNFASSRSSAEANLSRSLSTSQGIYHVKIRGCFGHHSFYSVDDASSLRRGNVPGRATSDYGRSLRLTWSDMAKGAGQHKPQDARRQAIEDTHQANAHLFNITHRGLLYHIRCALSSPLLFSSLYLISSREKNVQNG